MPSHDELLERAGYEVLAVADGMQAIATAQQADRIDVLITDVVMPGMSGIELAEQMIDNYPLMGVVLLSGYTAETLDLEIAPGVVVKIARGAVAQRITDTGDAFDGTEAALRAWVAKQGA